MSAALAEELHRLEAQGSTGVLRVGDGEFHLARGAIASAGCRRTIGLDRLAVEAGVATAEDWHRAGAGEPGALLHRPRLEALARLSVFDAAFFLLETSDEPEFLPTEEHWLAPVCRVAPRALVRECARRSRPGDSPWSADMVATTPVAPARRAPRKRVVLTAGQAEVLAAADAERSIAEIARDLGRTTYGCLVAVRDLTAANLIEPPAPRRRPATGESVEAPTPGRHLRAAEALTPGGDLAPAETPRRGPAPAEAPVPGRVAAPAEAPVPGCDLAPAEAAASGRHQATSEAPTPDHYSAQAPITGRHFAPTPTGSLPALPRRVPSGAGPTASGRHARKETVRAETYESSVTQTGHEPPRWQQVDREVLVRLRDALVELS
ncbi:hypothetical protein ACFO5K_20910 [Nocardia halotolerans]|uniref:MarR family transcriptional regulator n=1 Tax=Nocardia halotolerans TaxID=1755878 RepID=A0ABV8VKF9_9NOCA